MMNIQIEGYKEIIEQYKGTEFKIGKIAAIAINRTASHARALIVKMGRTDYTMPAKDLRKRITIKKANMRWLQAEIGISAKTISLQKFRYKGTGRRRGDPLRAASKTPRNRGKKILPVQVMVQKSTGYKKLGGAFVAKGKFGPAIFVRLTAGKRSPLKALQGPSPAGIVRNTANYKAIEASTQAKLMDEFQRGILYAWDKGKVAAGSPGAAE